MKRRLVPVVLLACVVGVVWALRRGGEQRERPVLRSAPLVPSPPEEEKVAYFFRKMVSADQGRIPSAPQANWRLFGEKPLRDMGRPALDFLLSEERSAFYRENPNVLANVLRFLPEVEGLRSHPRLYPFLLHWLDPGSCPRRVPGSDWPEDLRKQVFTVFTHAPGPPAVPFCEEELRREERVHDLRSEAVFVLLRCGAGGVLGELYDRMPPDREEPDRYLRHYVLDQIYGLAAAGGDGALRNQVEALRPVVERALESTFPGEGVKAAGVLLRLGDESMERWLLDECERSLAAGGEQMPNALAALEIVVNDGPNPRAKAICLRLLVGTTAPFAASFLARGWGDEEDVREAVWDYLGRLDGFDASTLARLVRVDRARVVAYVRDALRGEPEGRSFEACSFAALAGLAEVVPDMLDMVRREPEERKRAVFYDTLVRLDARGAIPLLRHELRRPGTGPDWRKAVATRLLQFGGDAVTPVVEALDELDEAVLLALVAPAAAGGAAAVPDAIVPPLLRAVREMPGEGGRRAALFVLRCRASLDGVQEGLVDAYRREPASRVAREIGEVLEELAHR